MATSELPVVGHWIGGKPDSGTANRFGDVFDPATVGPDMPTVASDLPSGALRLRQEASGFLATIVGGEIVLGRGRDTGARPGRLVRGPLHVRA